MKWITYILVVALLIIINQTIFNLHDFNGFVPDLFMLLVLAFIISFGNWDYIFFAVFGGFWMEIVVGLPVGSYILGLLLLGLGTIWIIDKWLYSTKDWRHFLSALIVGSIFLHVWLWFYSSLIVSIGWHWIAIDTGVMLKTLLPSLIANLILAYPVFIFTEFIAGFVQRWTRHKALI